MKKLLRNLFRGVLQSRALPAGAKLYLDAVKMFAKTHRDGHGTPAAVFVSFPYNSLGDVVAMFPLLERIHKEWPASRLDVAVGSALAPFVKCAPFLHVIPVKAVPHKGMLLWRWSELRELVRCFRSDLRENRYDIAISPRWGSDAYARASRYLMYLAPSKRYISYSASVDGGPASLDRLSTDLAVAGDLESESVRQIRLLERVGLVKPDLHLGDRVETETASIVAIARTNATPQMEALLHRTFGTRPGSYIVVSPGASRPSNRWPNQRYVEVLSRIHQQYGLQVLTIGGPADATVCELLSKALPGVVFSLGGKTTLLELAAILDRAKLFLGNDSGPAHMAGALGVPSVVLTSFALLSDQTHRLSALRWRPNGPHVLQMMPSHPVPPCELGCYVNHPHCILEITAAEVFAAAEKLLCNMQEGSSRGIMRSTE
jgi:ADP-heptose:LPS heptosyltransferase